MRIAILTYPSFRSGRFLADGLRRMLTRLGFKADVFYIALSDIRTIANAGASRRNRVMSTWPRIRHWSRNLAQYDLIVLSATIGIVGQTRMLELLERLNRPLMHYEVFAYCGSQYFVQQFGPDAQRFFSAFLTVSGIHDDPPIPGPPNFEIGMDLPDLAAFRSTRPFTALLDFARPGFEDQREMQIEALGRLKIPFETLTGEYSFREIDEVFSRAAIAFVACPEAFGVPIAQLQRHGSYIASPSPYWVRRHALCPAGHVYDQGNDGDKFTENFVFYDDVDELIEKLQVLRGTYDPRVVSERFSMSQNKFFQGCADELREAIHSMMKE